MTDLGRRSRIEVVEVEGPAFLACALINDDTSGHTDEDDALLDAFCAYLGGLHVVSTKDDEEPYFATIYMGGQRFAGDVVTYICHRNY